MRFIYSVVYDRRGEEILHIDCIVRDPGFSARNPKSSRRSSNVPYGMKASAALYKSQ